MELLGERYGTPVPDAYLRARAADPGAFQFSRGRSLRLRQQLLQSQERSAGPTVLKVLGPRDGAVVGTYRIPVLLGLFSDSPAAVTPFPRDSVENEYFGDGPRTITAYYDEVSAGKVVLQGVVQDWIRSDITQAVATGGKSGLVGGTVGPYIADLIGKVPDTDWGAFDNDGPDGKPNSGDDDGFVDVLAVIHAMKGAECGGPDKDDRIWSHRWSLDSARGSAVTTATASANGGFIRIDDYVIQPIYNCGGGALNEIGVFTHELGHAFGLPDLYDTYEADGKTNGAGNWDLMGTGSWGCTGNTPELPCHLSAWSKAVLGWVDVVTVADGADLGTLTLPPVETSRQVLRVNAQDGSGEYFLLENRARIGFDVRLLGEGLLIWQISPSILARQWPSNLVNGFGRMGVWLRQADGLDQLGLVGGGRGDSDDPFPYVKKEKENRVFHATSNPSAVSEQGTPTGVTVVDIQKAGTDITFRLLTRTTRVTVRADGAEGASGIFTVDGSPVAALEHTWESAPFVPHTVEVSSGETLGEGLRRPFLGWADSPDAPRVRTVPTPLADTTLVARYAGMQVELSIGLKGGVNGVVPGTFATQPAAPDLWFAKGTTVTVQAVPTRGFAFSDWSGALAGQPNPATVIMASPLQAEAGFTLIYEVPSTTVDLSAAEDLHLTLEPENGTYPYTWTVMSGTLPSGLELTGAGLLGGAAMETGTFPVILQVKDGLGLSAQGTVTLEVGEPVIPVANLGSLFLLSGPTLTLSQHRYLDLEGNGDGTYDLGDFRSWVLAHPGLPLTAALRALVAVPRTVVIPMKPVPAGRGAR